ncbi:6238_t:CDS:1, partial [Gigaspora margarita]
KAKGFIDKAKGIIKGSVDKAAGITNPIIKNAAGKTTGNEAADKIENTNAARTPSNT